jgi:hypothetical protein
MKQLCACVLLLSAIGIQAPAVSHVLNNLRSFGDRLDAGDPTTNGSTYSVEGPKDICTGDFDGDSRPDLALANVDGTVTVYFRQSGGGFSAPLHLQTGYGELRGIICADLTGDGRPDIATAAPYLGVVAIFPGQAGRSFGPRQSISAWRGARSLLARDFDGDGIQDLAVGGREEGVRHYRGTGAGEFVIMGSLPELENQVGEFPKPVYVLAALRAPGATRDDVVVTHAVSERVWILGTGGSGPLAITGFISTGASSNLGIHSLDVGPVTRQAAGNLPDLVFAKRDLGTIEVRQGIAAANRFSDSISQTIRVPGGPRALQIVDLDGDGWNDLAVVLRNFDCVLTYRNSNGVLVAATEISVGRSPREIAAADFSGDGVPDLAVMNRDSQDVSILRTAPGTLGFGIVDQFYPACGEVSGLAVLDLNGDNHDDVIQLHRSSDDFSVRLANANGLLAQPTFYAMGSLPSALSIADMTRDGIPDVVTANLGRKLSDGGSVSIRPGNGDGTFGAETRIPLATNTGGRLFAVVPADFDLDGYPDLAVGFLDCRIAFFKGDPTNGLVHTTTHFFTFEARAMVVGDFDGDGDPDLAGAGYAGDLVVVENTGDILTTTNLTRRNYPPPTEGKYGTKHMVAVDRNGDGDLDLILGSGRGAMLYLGGPGMSFTLTSETLAGTEFAASAVATGDFDGDGTNEVVVASGNFACVTVLGVNTNGNYGPILKADVPTGGYLETGDLDGDGLLDLVGSGSALWTALSGRAAQTVTQSITVPARQGITTHPVINEFLASNDLLPLEVDGGRKSDWLELYNGTPGVVSLNGWRLRLVRPDRTNDYSFPATAGIPHAGYLLLVCSDRVRTPYHTGFNLPAEGGRLSLINSAGVEVDVISYELQQPNISYGRYRDGLSALAFNAFPSPGLGNVDNGPIEPIVKLEGFDLATFAPDQPIRFYATAFDDVGLISVCVMYQRLDVVDTETHRVVLYDDGIHQDGGLLDGFFSGVLEPGLPPGGEIQFYLEVVDLSDQIVLTPDDPVFARAGQPVTLHSLAVDVPLPSIEISEVVAENKTGLQGTSGDYPDWLEVRNCGTTPLVLDGIGLGLKFFGNSSRFTWPVGTTLAPGEHRVVICDDALETSGIAPFTLDKDGAQVYLTATTPNGARSLVEVVTYGAQKEDVAHARMGCGGPWVQIAPTPWSQNVTDGLRAFVQGNQFMLVFPTTPGNSFTVESTGTLAPSAWSPLPSVAGTGIERAVSQPMASKRFFRVKRQ